LLPELFIGKLDLGAILKFEVQRALCSLLLVYKGEKVTICENDVTPKFERSTYFFQILRYFERF
jgi:hypothetical protein